MMRIFQFVRSQMLVSSPKVLPPQIADLSRIVGRKIIPKEVESSTRGKYQVVVLSKDEMQKLADHNFEKFLKDLGN